MLASPTAFINGEATTPTVLRTHVTSKAFWLLFSIEGLIIAGVCALILYFLLPVSLPLTRASDYTAVREAVVARFSGAVADPLIEVAPGVTARSSNVRGFARNGVTYYYYLEGQQSFDPLGRGAFTREQIEVVLRDANGPMPLVIYTAR